jgi:hypothetical protein
MSPGSNASNCLNVISVKRANNVEPLERHLRKKRWSCLILSVIGAIVISYILNMVHGVKAVTHLAGML